MSERKAPSYWISLIVTTGLAWLGLAGLADAIVEWQTWFEQGVLIHWTSVKAWISVMLFSWFPFHVPHWIVDYSVVGAVVAGSKPRRKWVEPPGFRMRSLPLKHQLEIHWSRIWHELSIYAFTLVCWPLFLAFVAVIQLFRVPENLSKEANFVLEDGSRPPPIVLTRDELNESRRRPLRRLLWRFLGFIPFLFVTSTLLYRFG
ncbi:hypothetical protein HKCCE3408_05655 [Rhodobacterales bacterium HKCCE3408]|nr:hypothetical protein [Rhodobacterales bacterium HKCCE3408]